MWCKTMHGSASRGSRDGEIVEGSPSVKLLGPIPTVHRNGRDLFGELLNNACKYAVESRVLPK